MDFVFHAAKGKSTDLAVVIHGLGGSPESMAGVIEVIQRCRPESDILVPRLPFCGWRGVFCFVPAEKIVCDIIAEIDRRWDAHEGGYRRIRFVGHSFGAVLARKIVILALGETSLAPGNPPLAPFEGAFKAYKSGCRWGDRITRLVLLAGMSRGWSAASARNWLLSAQWSIGSLIGELMAPFFGRGPTVFAIRQGAPFIIQTRLQWLAILQAKRLASRDVADVLIVVQALGTVDDSVSPKDTVDHAIDLLPDTGGRFYFLEMPGTDHSSVVRMRADDPKFRTWDARRGSTAAPDSVSGLRALITDALADPEVDEETLAVIRGRIFAAAVCADAAGLQAIALAPEHLADDDAPAPNPDVRDVVFVIHGIRDRGFWTQKIAHTIKREWQAQNASTAGERRLFHSLTPSYGYFAMFPFVLPWVRRMKTAWLMERYTEAKARFPNAQISYVGHSNGTYLAARALADYPAVRFKRVVFAGSVVRKRYEWAPLLAGGDDARVQGVLNYVATKDAVVALFPKGMQPLRIFDLGSAGHDGFKPEEALPRDRFGEVRYVDGGHSAGIKESQWDDIARFIVRGTVPEREAARQSFWVRAGGFVSTILLLAGAVYVVGLGLALFNGMTGAAAFDLGVDRLFGHAWLAWIPQILATLFSPIVWLGDAAQPLFLAAGHWTVWAMNGFASAFPSMAKGLSSAATCIPAVSGWQIAVPCLTEHNDSVTAAWRAALFAAYCGLAYVILSRF